MNDQNQLNIRGVRRERAAERVRRNIGKVKLNARAAYTASQLRKAKEHKNHRVEKDTWL